MSYEIAVAVPAYNERDNLPVLVEAYQKEKGDVRFQLVIVDNGSNDGSAEVLKELCRKNPFVKAVTIKRNIGYGYGIHQGLLACDAPVIGFSHADMQCHPKDVFEGYRIYKGMSGKRLVKGHRASRIWKEWILTQGLWLYSCGLFLSFFDDINGQPKLFGRDMLEHMTHPPMAFTYDLYVQQKAQSLGYTVRPFTVQFLKRMYGESKGSGKYLIQRVPTIIQYLRDVAKLRVGIFR